MFTFFNKMKAKHLDVSTQKEIESASTVDSFIAKYDPMNAKFFARHEPHPLRGYSNFGTFEIHGLNPKTGRQNKKVIEALTHEEAIAAAAGLGLQEPITANEISSRMATDRQLEYMEQLGIEQHSGLSLLDASCLISKSHDREDDCPGLSFSQWLAACQAGVRVSALMGPTCYRSAMGEKDCEDDDYE